MIFNVTDISSIVFLDSYAEFTNRDLTYDDFTLYIINTGYNKLLLYYGSRKLTDTLISNGIPSSPEYPSNKLYLSIKEKEDHSFYLDNAYYKYQESFRDPEIASINDSYFKIYLSPSESNLWLVNIVTDDESDLSLVSLNSDKQLNQTTLNAITSGVTDQIVSKYKEDPTWSLW